MNMGYFEEQFGMHVQSKTKESQTAVFGDVRISVLTAAYYGWKQ